MNIKYFVVYRIGLLSKRIRCYYRKRGYDIWGIMQFIYDNKEKNLREDPLTKKEFYKFLKESFRK